MAISLVDTAVPMNDTGYPIARAKHIWFDDDVTLQDKLDNKELGGGDNSVTLTQSEYDALDEQVKLEGEFYCYDSGRHFRNGIEFGKDGVQISDNETVEDKTWSSKKTSDEIAKVETELNAKLEDKADTDKAVKKIYITDRSSEDARQLIQNHWNEFATYEFYNLRLDTSKWAWNAEIYKDEQGFGTVLLMTYGFDFPNIFYGKLYSGVWSWRELATMDKVALKQEHFDKKVTLTDSNWKYAKIPFTKSYMNTPSVNISCGDYLNPEFYSYWGCEAYIININNKGCTIRYRSSKASESEPLEVSIIVFVNGI